MGAHCKVYQQFDGLCILLVSNYLLCPQSSSGRTAAKCEKTKSIGFSELPISLLACGVRKAYATFPVVQRKHKPPTMKTNHISHNFFSSDDKNFFF